jgi:hypothetical protein
LTYSSEIAFVLQQFIETMELWHVQRPKNENKGAGDFFRADSDPDLKAIVV